MEGANSHLYCVFKVFPVTREFDPKLCGRKGCISTAALRSALSSLQRTRGPASQCRTHVRASRHYVRAFPNAKVSSSALLTCVTAVALQRRMFSTDIFHKVARNMHLCEWNIFRRTSFRSFILSPLCTLAVLHLYVPTWNRTQSGEWCNDTLFAAKVNSMLYIKGGKIYVKREEKWIMRESEWKTRWKRDRLASRLSRR